MGIMEKIRGIGSDKSEFKEKLKQAQQEMKIQNVLEERQKSSNRREVERLLKKKEEAEYKKFLDNYRQKETKELWSSKSNKILSSQKSMLKNDRPILKEKNIFKNEKNIFMNQGGMFLK